MSLSMDRHCWFLNFIDFRDAMEVYGMGINWMLSESEECGWMSLLCCGIHESLCVLCVLMLDGVLGIWSCSGNFVFSFSSQIQRRRE